MSFLIPDINTFFLLHTHFFSLLVYHVPILSCNPTVYTLCTVSTWGSVYVRQKKRRMQQHCERNPDALVHAAGERRWIAVPDRLAIRKPHIRKSLERHIFDFSAAFSARHSPRNRGDESAAFLMGAHAFTDLCSDFPGRTE